MVGASKILTVSYGTFSCTLEGFDEPFSTMKAIAEYFRDLAADDRYFGAEPPTPDAEMLHKIAEREIQRRVDAKISEHGIVLRPQGAQADQPATAPAPAAAKSAAAPAPAVAERVTAPEDDGVAAKLQRIRAVVATTHPASGANEPEAEFASAAPMPGDDFGFDIDLGDDLSEPMEASPAVGAGPASDSAAPEDDKPSYFERARARVIKIHRAAAENDGTSPQAIPAAPEAGRDADVTVESPDEDDQRSAIFAALHDDAGAAATDEPQDDAVDAAEDDEDSTLLAGISAAIGAAGHDHGTDAPRNRAEPPHEPRRPSHTGRAILEARSDNDEASVERLMEVAKSKLEGVENRRRFSAITQLKAAVVATVADRKLKSSDDEDRASAAPRTDLDRYRDDLSKAVRPRPPVTGMEDAEPAPAPAAEPRPAPLVLVSAQRIDAEPEPAPADEEIIQPRRVSAGHHDLDEADVDEAEVEAEAAISPEDARNFADFAERLGATSLVELLEAAAAYTATVEGQPHFSRPQILRKIARVSDEVEYSREDGLRSFGMLLRQGKIQKVRRGQFAITEASRFMSEARHATR
ncbi:hypothetical protein [Defluviimonas salinarum]|uniref:Lipoprotein n=1 Tax=Defluviimonas salinarum TaxID=2992147 RepID=A0ABT3J2K7_9RHOB|nr:hypothetical protein [Defluviimonas salinarum]MCW3781909.1 hypothetical protein [Defluviimonas salinarum]